MRNSIRKRGMAILMSAFMLFQFLPGQLLGQIMNDKSIVANAESFDAAQNERDVYNYIRDYCCKNPAAISGVLAYYYENPETYHFEVDNDTLMSIVNDEMGYFIHGILDGVKIPASQIPSLSYVSQLISVPKSDVGAFDAGSLYARYIIECYMPNHTQRAVYGHGGGGRSSGGGRHDGDSSFINLVS